MDIQTAISIASLLVTASVALVVPVQAFKFALRQEQVRLLREQRVALYADMLVEAHAEQQGLTWWLANQDASEELPFEDTRLPALERARFGARGTAVGSAKVNRLFNTVQAVAGRIHLLNATGRMDRDTALMQLRLEACRAQDALEAAIRAELRSDMPLPPSGSTWLPDRRRAS
ncbi:hypothetical protein [Streptomyces sp. NPDC014623]|uniref:hypothetical protein n=1 Tax=Streptomyces sp. NPDC014623 TaxID=3364875 RepID=UPI0036FA67F9